MLKKKNILVAIFSFLFCFSIMFGNILTNGKNNQQNSVYAEVTVPSLDSSGSAEDGSWSYNIGTGELTLNGIEWVEQTLVIPERNIIINIVGENTIQNTDVNIFNFSYDETTITFTGSGSLSLSVGQDASIFNIDDSTRIILDEVNIKEDIQDDVTIEPSEALALKSFVICSSHTHSYTTYTANGATLTATCSCDDSKSGSVSIADINVNETLAPEFNMTELSLTKDSFNIEYYKVDTKDVVTGGELAAEPSAAVGYYYLKATPKAETGISADKYLVCSFEVKELRTVITGQDKTTTYDGEGYDLSKMFTFDEHAGERIYSIVAEGTTGEGVVYEGNKLFIDKAGVFNIKVTVAGRDGYAGAELVKKLTVEKFNPVLGEGVGEVHLVLFGVDSNQQEVEYAGGWAENEITEIRPRFVNYVGGGQIEIKYFRITAGGNEEIEGFSSEAGEYLITVTIEENDVSCGCTLSKEYIIKDAIGVQVADGNVYYNEFVDSKYDISNLLEISSDLASDIESITYYWQKTEMAKIELQSSLFEVLYIDNGTEGDVYNFEAFIQTKANSEFSSTTITFSMTVMKYDGIEIAIEDKIYDNQAITYSVVKNDYDAAYTIEFYLGETLLDSAPVNAGRYSLKVIAEETGFTRRVEKEIQFKINKREISIVWQEDDFTYKAEEQTVSAHYVDLEGNEVPLRVLMDKLFRDVSFDGTNPYEYTARASFVVDSENYTLPTETTNVYHMKPMQLQVEVLNRSKFYKIAASPRLAARAVSGKVFLGDKDPWTLRVDAEINADTPIGFYPIIAESNNDPNYSVTFINSAVFKVKNRILTSDMIDDWVYLQTPSVPHAEVDVGEVRFSYYKGEELLSAVPTEPGKYTLYACVGDNEDDINWAESTEDFIIDRITVNVPNPDPTQFVFDGLKKTYRVMDPDLTNASLYTVGANEFVEAGTHKVALIISDTSHYRWPNGEDIYYLDCVIKKKQIEKPAADSRVYKYNGKPITYTLATSEFYQISSNVTQTEVGRYKVIVQLEDTFNTVWSDGTSANLVYDFVINQSRIDKAVIKDAEGNAISSKEVSIVDISGNGVSPESILQVEISKANDTKNIDRIKTQLTSVMSKYDKIFKIADVKLVQYGVSVQPENSITLKMLIPEELSGANFRLYHIHINSNGEEVVSEVEYSKVDKDGYITFQTDKLSSFAFVYEQSSLKAKIITFAVLSGVMFILLVLQVVFFILLKKKSKAKILAAAAPVFFVKSEVSTTIALGCVFGALAVVNVVMLVLNILAYRAKKCKEKQDEEKSKTKAKTKTKAVENKESK